MFGFGIFGLVSGALQVTVPSYSLRLVRRFGTSRAGWFVVAAFSLLALLHLLTPTKPTTAAASAGLSADLMFAMAATLLIIGLGHVETLLSERHRAEYQEERLRTQCRTEAQENMDDLARMNDELRAQIAQLEQSQSTVRDSEAAYRLLFTENPQAMWVIDLRSLRFLGVNNAALRQLGYGHDEFMALTARDLLPPAAVARFQQDMALPCSTPGTRGRWQHYRKDRSMVEIEITALDLRYAGQPVRLILANDVGVRQQCEREFLQAQRHEMARQMTGSFAQHLNDALTTVSSQTNYLLRQSPDQAATNSLNRIAAAVNSATRLSRQLLMAGGHFVTQPERLDLNGALRTLRPMIQHLAANRVVFQQAYVSDLPRVLADARLVEHIVISLVLNALDAMPRGGNLTIATSAVRVEESQSPSNAAARSGEFVRLAVRDNGCGMTPEVQAHLFEPFFTTRGAGHGNGLGLASVFGAVKLLSGWIEVATTPGAGSEFRVFLPLAPPAPPATESDFRRWVRY